MEGNIRDISSRMFKAHVQGTCHCGAVQFEVEAGESVEVEDGNYSICRMTGFLHLVVPQTALRLLMGAEFLTVFRFNAHVAEYTFGEICGIKLF